MPRLFQSDPDIRLAGTDIFVDATEPRPVGIVSHGHADHIGAHHRFIATAPTAAFLRVRQGAHLRGDELSYGTPVSESGYSIELFPAGHILGAAMVRISRDGDSLLYTGDFRLRTSLTCEEAVVPKASSVIMESTYGSPEWRFPTREEIAERLVDIVSGAITRGRVPVLLAYSLGKSQEVCAMLTRAGIKVAVHPVVHEMCEIYSRFGVDLGSWEVWSSQASLLARSTTQLRGKAVIVPPHMKQDIKRIHNRETIALTGWALRWSQGVDHALPLSDHADYDELLELVDRCGAEVVYVTHGSSRFAADLRRRGVRAEFVRKKPQMRLF